MEESDVKEENSGLLLEEIEEDRRENGGWVIQTELQQADDSNIKPPSFLSSCYSKINSYWIFSELITLAKLSIPITLALVFQQAVFMISLMFVGHIPSNDQEGSKSLNLDSLGLAGTVINVTGLSIGIGLSTAADTLCSQTYGYKNYKRVGVIFQRGVLILFLTSLFICWVWLNTESILLLLQQPPCVARLTGRIVQICCLSLPGIFLFVMLQKYLQSQGIVWPFIITGFLSSLACIGLNALFMFVFHWGVIGVAIVYVLTNYIFPLLLIAYIRIRKLHRKTWGGWTMESLEDWGQFYKLGLPGIGMVCMEWISFEISTLVLGTLGEIELAINAVLINVITMAFMIPLGLSIAVTIRVGNELGAGNPTGAKRASFVSIGLIFILVLIISAVLQGIGGNIGILYNVEEEVYERLKDIVILLGFLIITDQIQGVMSGIIRGAGHQLWGAGINFIAFYVVGLPVGIPLSLATNWKSFGMWSGLFCASIVQTVGYSIALTVLKWKKESELAIKRAGGGEGEREGGGGEREGGEGDGLSVKVEEKNGVIEMVSLKKYQPLKQEVDLEQEVGPEVDLEQEMTQEVEEEVEEDRHSLTDTLLQTNDSSQLSDNTSHNTDTKVATVPSWRHILKLLLKRGILYIIGLTGCVLAGIASMYHPPDWLINGNFTECETGSTDLFIVEPSPSSLPLIL